MHLLLLVAFTWILWMRPIVAPPAGGVGPALPWTYVRTYPTETACLIDRDAHQASELGRLWAYTCTPSGEQPD